MTRSLALLALSFFLLVGGAREASASLYHFYDGVSDPPPTFPFVGRAVEVSSSQWAAQSFRASASYSLTRVAVWADDSSNLSELATLEVRPDAGGAPAMGGPPLALDSVGASLPYRWVEFTFPASVLLTAGQMYWIVMRNATGTTSAGWYWWNTRSDTYVDPGLGLLSGDQGVTWSPGGIGDFTLRTFGYEETRLSLAALANRTELRYGDSFRLAVWFNNTGTEVAERVWINVTLPAAAVFESDNASSIGGIRTIGSANWVFPSVERGSYYFLIIASVTGPVSSSQLVVVRTTLAYTDFEGILQTGSEAVLTVVVSGGPPPPAFPLWLVAAGVFPVVAAVGLILRRGGKVEEVFLVHLSGLLIVHLSKSLRNAKDRDILAGMLTAIQQFVRETFVDPRGLDVQVFDFGDRKIVIHRGVHAFLAVVVRGAKPRGLSSRMRRAMAELEETFDGALEDWSGDLDVFSGADDILSRGLLSGRTPRIPRLLLAKVRRAEAVPAGTGPRGARKRFRGGDAQRAILRDHAARLRQRPELDEVEETVRSFVAAALDETSGGAFTVCGFANIYLAGLRLGRVTGNIELWWNDVVRLVRDVLNAWSWDPESQAWICGASEGPRPRLAGTERDAAGDAEVSRPRLEGRRASRGRTPFAEARADPRAVAPVAAPEPVAFSTRRKPVASAPPFE